MRFVILLTTIILTFANSFLSSNPTWLTNNYFRANNQEVISTLTGNNVLPNFTFIYSSPCNGTPSLGYGIKNYRGDDYFGQQFYEIRKIGLNSTSFSVEIQIFGITNLYILTVAYIAVQPNFPHHLNTFDNVPLNYSSGDIVNISVKSSTRQQFTQYIDYTNQSSGRLFSSFNDSDLSNYKIVLFITSLWIRGDYGIPVRIHIYPEIVNLTHYKWMVTAEFRITVTRLQFSQIIFNQEDVESSRRYYIVYEQWITDLNGGFRAVPSEFVDNFIMAITDFQAVEAKCGFQYQWEYQTNNSTGEFGVRILYSWTLTNTCGFSWARSSIFYMKTWLCNPPYYFFNITTNLCQTSCGYGYYQVNNSGLYYCERGPCQNVCTNCSITNMCLSCVNASYYQLIHGYCYCQNGTIIDQNGTFGTTPCVQICGDGILMNLQCDDGNLLNGDGCSSTCTVQTGYLCPGGSLNQSSTCVQICGDGILINLQCDDGNLLNGDGCSSTCTVQTGYLCPGGSFNQSSTCAQICGDGILINLQCDDGNLLNGDGCSSTCTVETGYLCPGGSLNQSSTCSQICGDGIVINVACDDGNLINGDGCSSTCIIQQYYNCTKINSTSVCSPICGDGYLIINGQNCEDNNTDNGDGCSPLCQIQPGYNCTTSNLTNLSVCTLTTIPSLTLLKYWKDPSSNTVLIQLQLQTQMTINNISQFISLNFPHETKEIVYDPITSLITIQFTYQSTLNSQKQLSLIYGPASNLSTYVMPQSTDNQLSIKYYDKQYYKTRDDVEKLSKALGFIASGLFMVGLLVSRLIPIQAIFIFQFTYCGLIMLKKRQGLMDPLKQLWITNGFNILKDDQIATDLPSRIRSMYYQGQFLSNFNFNILLITLPITIGIILYFIGKFKSFSKLQQWGKRMLKEIQFTFLLFVLFQLFYAFIINFQSKNIVIGIILSFLLFLTVCFYSYMFKNWQQNFGEYKQFFKDTPLGQNFYIFALIKRSILALSMIGLSQTVSGCIVAFMILLIWGLVLLLIRPYNNNIRPIGNWIMQLIIAIIFLNTRLEIDSSQVKQVSYVPLLIIAILLINLTFNLVFLILQPLDIQKCSNTTFQDNKIQNTQENFLAQQSDNKKSADIAKSNKIANENHVEIDQNNANDSMINNIFNRGPQQQEFKQIGKVRQKKKKRKRSIKVEPQQNTHLIFQYSTTLRNNNLNEVDDNFIKMEDQQQNNDNIFKGQKERYRFKQTNEQKSRKMSEDVEMFD